MPTPASGQISMQDVYNETNFTREMSNFYSTSMIGGIGGLMYHNLTMGPSNNLDAKTAIFDRFTASTNFYLSYWYNYSQTPDLLISWNITNNNTDYDIQCQIFISGPGVTSSLITTVGPLNNSGGNSTQTNFNTGLVVNTANFGNGVYEIEMVCDATNYVGGTPPGPGVTSTVLTCSDMDVIGTVGDTRVGNNPPAFTLGSPTPQFPIVQGVVGASGSSIYVNKRTLFNLTFV